MRPQRRKPTRLPHPWGSPDKNTGVGCHFLLQCMKVKSESEVAQFSLTLSDPLDFSLGYRLLCPWDFPGKSTGVGCHCLLWLVAQSCPTLCNPMDYIACKFPLFMEFSRQEYWSRLPFPSPGFNPTVHLSVEAFAIVRRKKKKTGMIFKFLPRSVASHLLTSTSHGWFHLASSLTLQRGPYLLPTKINPVPSTEPCTLALTLH